MSKIQSSLVFDNSSLANYKGWAWGPSSVVFGLHQALEQMGFVQTSDQGQVVWNSITATITSVASTGSIATYGYSTLSPADPITTNRTLRAGMIINSITGLTNTIYNIAAPGGVLILSVTPATTTTGTFTTATVNPSLGTTSDSGSFSIPGITLPTAWTTNVGVANQAAVAYNGVSTAGLTTTYRGLYNGGTTYAIGDVVTYAGAGNVTPNNYIAAASSTGSTPDTTTGFANANWRICNYAIWQTNDSISPTYYLKVEYSNNGGVTSNTPGLWLTLGTATTGALVASGSFGGGSLQTAPPNCLTNREFVGSTAAQAAGAAATYECDFFGGTANGGVFSALMWRTAGTLLNANVPMFFSIERSLNTSGTYVGTYMTLTKGNAPGTTAFNWICEPVMPGGSNPGIGSRTDFVPSIAMPTATSYFPGNANSYQIGQNIAALPGFPLVGYLGNPFLNLLVMRAVDAVEGGTFTSTVYGSTHTYLMTKTVFANYVNQGVTLFGSGGAIAMRWE